MADKKKKTTRKDAQKFTALNRKARHDFEIGEQLEAGLVLTGTEVKALRAGRVNIAEAYAGIKFGEIYLLNANIGEYKQAGQHLQHEPRRARKLLLHKKQRNKLIGAIQREGATLVPLSLYFNARGRAKLQLAVAKGRKQHDKRAAIKDREWKKEQGRLIRNKG
jgi:SsrA-binding protein